MIGSLLPSSRHVSLYFHIPFCTKKCHYCHFFVLPDKAAFHRQLIDSIKLDLARWKEQLQGKELVSIYFGGGTPSLLTPEEIDEILETVAAYITFDPSKIEITLEANPETLSADKLKKFKNEGINRLSIGVQSLDDTLLEKLGRTHGMQEAMKGIWLAADTGYDNISIDLMYDIPYQTLSAWQHTLEQAVKLPITHLSLYNLTIEPHTVFFKYRETLLKEVPDADNSAAMYRTAVETLTSAGLSQYEISAFCKPGCQSRHNVGYWTARPFLGFGPSAFSYWEGRRFRAVANLNAYARALQQGDDPADFSEQLDPPARRRELLAIAIRLKEGVDLMEFEACHGPLCSDTHAALKKLAAEGLIAIEGSKASLTDQGILFYDTVATELV